MRAFSRYARVGKGGGVGTQVRRACNSKLLRNPLLGSRAMDLERLAVALAPAEVVGRAAARVTDLAYDARRAGPGSVFFCVPGARADGHDFAAEAVQRGSVGLVVERLLDLPVPQIVVDDARAAMPRAAVAFFDDPSRALQVVGVTGTSG